MVTAPILQQVEDEVLHTITARSADVPTPLWEPGEVVVVAVSGGADSLCLGHVLRALRPLHGGELHVAHLDHGFRDLSREEAAYVEALAHEWGLPVTVGSVDGPAVMAREGWSPEEAARRVRYRFLAGVAKKTGAAVVALGHTADDQVETVLMHLLRGAGLRGLRGMRPLAPAAPWMAEGLVSRLQLARPLLQVTRAETEAYCAEAGLSPVRDAWNEDARFLRVRLRRQVLPLLETINPQVGQALLRLSQLAGWLDEDLRTMLEARWPEVATPEENRVCLSLAAWSELPWTLRLLSIRRAVASVRGHLAGLGWGAVVAAGRLDQATVRSEVALVEDVVARRTYEAILIGRRTVLDRVAEEAGDWPELGDATVPVEVPGRTPLPGGYALVATRHPPEKAHWQEAGRWEAWLDAGRCGERLWLRTRRPGDRFQPLGMTGRKKLQDLFVDQKVPWGERDRVPLVCSPRGIVWVVGYRMDRRFRVRPESQGVVHLRWERPKGAV